MVTFATTGIEISAAEHIGFRIVDAQPRERACGGTGARDYINQWLALLTRAADQRLALVMHAG